MGTSSFEQHDSFDVGIQQLSIVAGVLTYCQTNEAKHTYLSYWKASWSIGYILNELIISKCFSSRIVLPPFTFMIQLITKF